MYPPTGLKDTSRPQPILYSTAAPGNLMEVGCNLAELQSVGLHLIAKVLARKRMTFEVRPVGISPGERLREPACNFFSRKLADCGAKCIQVNPEIIL